MVISQEFLFASEEKLIFEIVTIYAMSVLPIVVYNNISAFAHHNEGLYLRDNVDFSSLGSSKTNKKVRSLNGHSATNELFQNEARQNEAAI